MRRQVYLFIRQERAGDLLHAVAVTCGVGILVERGVCAGVGERWVRGRGRGTAELFEEVCVPGRVEVDVCGVGVAGHCC